MHLPLVGCASPRTARPFRHGLSKLSTGLPHCPDATWSPVPTTSEAAMHAQLGLDRLGMRKTPQAAREVALHDWHPPHTYEG